MRCAKEAGDWFTRVNMKLGDTTDKWDFLFAAYDYEFAEPYPMLPTMTLAMWHPVASLTRWRMFVSNRTSRARNAGGQREPVRKRRRSDMITERWRYPAQWADRLLDTHRYREVRLSLAVQQELADEQWKIAKWFAARLKGMDGESLKQLYH